MLRLATKPGHGKVDYHPLEDADGTTDHGGVEVFGGAWRVDASVFRQSTYRSGKREQCLGALVNQLKSQRHASAVRESAAGEPYGGGDCSAFLLSGSNASIDSICRTMSLSTVSCSDLSGK